MSISLQEVIIKQDIPLGGIVNSVLTLGPGAGVFEGLSAHITGVDPETGLHNFNVFLPEPIISPRGKPIEGVIIVTASTLHAPLYENLLI